MASTFVSKASPANSRLAIERAAASSWPKPQASITTTGMYPRSAAVPRCGFNADFHGDAHNGERVNPTIAERDVQRSAFKS